MNIAVPEHVAAALSRKAALAGKDLITFLQEIAKDDSPDQVALTPRRISREEFRNLLKEIVELSPGSGGKMNDSRESIYAGCGE